MLIRPFAILAVTGLLLFLTAPVLATERTANAQSVFGFWDTQDKDGIIELYPCGDKICGRFAWIEQTSNEPPRDRHNPDAIQRTRPLCQMQFMGDFTTDGANHYSAGWIYSPRHGERFDAELTLLSNDSLLLRGYFLIPVLGDNQTWTRTANTKRCQTAT